MDNLQTQTGNQTTGNPQSIGQSSLVTGGSNLQQAVVGNQNDLAGLSAPGLSVVQCTQNCVVQNPTPTTKPANHNNGLILGSLIFTAILLIWLAYKWFSIKTVSQKNLHASEEQAVVKKPAKATEPKAKPIKKKRKKSKAKKRRR